MNKLQVPFFYHRIFEYIGIFFMVAMTILLVADIVALINGRELIGGTLMLLLAGLLFISIGKRLMRKRYKKFKGEIRNFVEENYGFTVTDDDLIILATPVDGAHSKQNNFISKSIDRLETAPSGQRFLASYAIVNLQNNFLLFDVTNGIEFPKPEEEPLSEEAIAMTFKDFYETIKEQGHLYFLDFPEFNNIAEELPTITQDGELFIHQTWSNLDEAKKFITNFSSKFDEETQVTMIEFTSWINKVKSSEKNFILAYEVKGDLYGIPLKKALSLIVELSR